MTATQAPLRIEPIEPNQTRSAIPETEQAAIDAIVAAQKANGDPIDPAGAKRFVRALVAVGLFKPA